MRYNDIINDVAQPKEEDFFFLKEILNASGLHDYVVQYFSLLYRFFSIVAKADNAVTPTESKWLETLMSYSTAKKTMALIFLKRKQVKKKNRRKTSKHYQLRKIQILWMNYNH